MVGKVQFVLGEVLDSMGVETISLNYSKVFTLRIGRRSSSPSADSSSHWGYGCQTVWSDHG
jgi:hypothetical protein